MIATVRRATLLRLVLFVVGAAASLMFAIAAGSAFIGVLGGARPLVVMALISALASAALLVVTAGVLRLEGVTLSVLGLTLDRRAVGELAGGFAVSAVLFLGVAWAQSAMVGASWRLQGPHAVLAALADLPLVACLVMGEELLFRGAALRNLCALAGER